MTETDMHPPSPAEATRERTADRIRRTAHDLFYTQGIRAVGVDEIAARSGVTKPSLYRNFASKDDLAAAYLEDYDREFWKRFDEAVASDPDPRRQLQAFFARLAERATQPHYRGCGLTNAAVEFPAHDNPARLVAERHKRGLRARLQEMAAAMGAAAPAQLADGLLLLIEGAYVSGQLFGEGGPARSVAVVADQLIGAALNRV